MTQSACRVTMRKLPHNTRLGKPMNYLSIFYQQAKARSLENLKAFDLLIENGCYGVAAGLLRQELDTLVRISYLCRDDIDEGEVFRLVKDSVEGKRWKKVNARGRLVPITDREMVDLANEVGGWVSYVYEFGCKFIHLSSAHSYDFVDPLSDLSNEDKESIVGYLKDKHEYPHSELTFELVKPFLSNVMQKITKNVEATAEVLLIMNANE